MKLTNMTIKNIRGWVGLLVFGVGIVLAIFEATRSISWLVMGVGVGMMSSGF